MGDITEFQDAPIGGYYGLPGLGGFDNGEKCKDSRVLYILKLEELESLAMEGEERDSAKLIAGEGGAKYWERKYPERTRTAASRP